MKILPTDKCFEAIPVASQAAGDGRTEGAYGGFVQTDPEQSPTTTLHGLFQQ